MKLLLVAADAMEFHGILAHSSEIRRPAMAVDWARLATLGGHSVMLAANGAGAKRASAAVDRALEKFDADAVISTGFCGALDDELAIADVVVACDDDGGGGEHLVAGDHKLGDARAGLRGGRPGGLRGRRSGGEQNRADAGGRPAIHGGNSIECQATSHRRGVLDRQSGADRRRKACAAGVRRYSGGDGSGRRGGKSGGERN